MRHSQGTALRRLMRRHAEVLLPLDTRPYGWSDGGCRIAAYGLLAWVRASGYSAEIAVVLVPGRRDRVQHFVLAVEGPAGRHYLDGDGIRRGRSVCASLRSWTLKGAYLVRYNPCVHTAHEVDAAPATSAHLARLLMAELGPYHPV